MNGVDTDVASLRRDFPGWLIARGDDGWSAARADDDLRLSVLAVTDVRAGTVEALRAALEVIAGTDAEILLRRLARALGKRGRRARWCGGSLAVRGPDGDEKVVTCSGGRFRWDGGWPVGSVTDVEETAALIDRAMWKARSR
ncbi:hypothetical protein [Actinomadura miaoliensis]|uniref:Uncharacterized protein n=1 Tax=Actinomadura miaoliensis TaxID=430685 RepID=A0ABP7X4W8_9ACTN